MKKLDLHIVEIKCYSRRKNYAKGMVDLHIVEIKCYSRHL